MTAWSDHVPSEWEFNRNGARMTHQTRTQEAEHHMNETRRCLFEAHVALSIELDHYLTPLEAAHAGNALDEVRNG